MKCPRCETAISSPEGRSACVNGVEVLMVICPHCETTLFSNLQQQRRMSCTRHPNVPAVMLWWPML